MQVLTLGSEPEHPSPGADLGGDTLQQIASNARVPVFVSEEQAGGLTYLGCTDLFRRLPLLRGLRELRVCWIGSSAWRSEHEGMLRFLAEGIASLPGLQVRRSSINGSVICD